MTVALLSAAPAEADPAPQAAGTLATGTQQPAAAQAARAQTSSSTAEPCNLDGTATGPCEIAISLGDRVLSRPFPFDAPVFLTGTLQDTPEQKDIQFLVLHVFTAHNPIRVARTCADSTNTLELDWKDCLPEKRQLTCFRQGDIKDVDPQARWNLNALAAASLEEKCELLPQVSTWMRADPTDKAFTLRVPPVPSNRYFVLYLEAGAKLSESQAKEVEEGVRKAIVEAIRKAANRQGGSFEEWAAELGRDLCRPIKKLEQRSALSFPLLKTPLLKCGDPKEEDFLNSLGALFSQLADLREQLRIVEEERKNLSDALKGRLPGSPKFLIESESKGAFGIPLARLDSPDFQLDPTKIDRSRVEALRKEIDQVEPGTVRNEEAKGSVDTLRDALGQIDKTLSEFEKTIGTPEAKAKAIARSVISFQASNIGSFLTRQKGYLSADFGILYASSVEQSLPYLGTNIYFVPVNKQAPLPRLPWRQPLKRVGVTLGLTLGEFDADRAEPLFSSMNLITGAGYRVTESIRLGAGVVLFREASKDPLSGNKSLVFSPYASVSFDYDVNSLINWFNKLFS